MGIFKDENGNSYGDWTHRGQGRTRDAANSIVTTGDEKKWYDQTFWIIFFLVVLWPDVPGCYCSSRDDGGVTYSAGGDCGTTLRAQAMARSAEQSTGLFRLLRNLRAKTCPQPHPALFEYGGTVHWAVPFAFAPACECPSRSCVLFS